MFNLKKFNGTFKGNIGECMFKLTKRYLFLTRFHSKIKVISSISKYLKHNQIDFLKKNWYSIDSIEIADFKPILYEIKTKNKYKTSCFEKPKLTQSTVDIYKKAVVLGFDVKIAMVIFCDNWEFEISIMDFIDSNYHIDGKRMYDKN